MASSGYASRKPIGRRFSRNTRRRSSGPDPAWPPSKEYVAVPDDLLSNTRALKPYLERSYQYAQTLRPKATKKK